MLLIIGLGNPGPKYQSTRHNVGCNIIQKFAARQNLNFSHQPKLQAYTTSIGAGLPAGRQGSDRIILAYPDTYMNLSGQSVRKILDYYKIDPSNLYVIHDELDLGVGEWKLQFDRGPAGHNGIKSIIDHLGTQAFHRIRIGVGHPRASLTPSLPVEDYVLLPFTKDEQVIINQTIDKILPEIDRIINL